jgi:hypothetical protein
MGLERPTKRPLPMLPSWGESEMDQQETIAHIHSRTKRAKIMRSCFSARRELGAVLQERAMNEKNRALLDKIQSN